MWIRLKNIQLHGYHGVYEHEREHGGRFEIDVEVRADLSVATKSDDLNATIDYTKIAEAVTDINIAKHYHLVESLSDAIATDILAQFAVEEVIVRVRKPGAAVGIVLDTVEVECRKLKSEG